MHSKLVSSVQLAYAEISFEFALVRVRSGLRLPLYSMLYKMSQVWKKQVNDMQPQLSSSGTYWTSSLASAANDKAGTESSGRPALCGRVVDSKTFPRP
jgi:hypothetical protein